MLAGDKARADERKRDAVGGGGAGAGGKKKSEKNMSEIDEHILKRFDIKKRLGKGAYGIVWKAVDRKSKDTVAIKKIFDAFRNQTDAQRTFREIIFLQAFRNHPNIVKLHSIHKALNNRDIYLGFEYMETDLHCVIKRGNILKDVHKRYIMYQILKATKYIHSGNVIHRDQKPSNVLIDSACRVKLADFGLARSVSALYRGGASPGEDDACLTDYVATRWYRAPEILIASKNYTKGIDMWSLGCILGEMLCGRPLFPGSSTVNQVERIMVALPRPDADDIAAVCSGYGSSLITEAVSSGKDGSASLSNLVSCAPRDAADLVQRLLVFNPAKRLSAEKALDHEYVKKFHCGRSEPALGGDVVLPLRDDQQLSVDDYRNQLYALMARPKHPHPHPPDAHGRKAHAGLKQAPTAPSKQSRSEAEVCNRAPCKPSARVHPHPHPHPQHSAYPPHPAHPTLPARPVASERNKDVRSAMFAAEQNRRCDWQRPDWLEPRARGDGLPPPQRGRGAELHSAIEKRPSFPPYGSASYGNHGNQSNHYRRSSSSFSTLALGGDALDPTAGNRGARYGVITASAFMDLRTSMRLNSLLGDAVPPAPAPAPEPEKNSARASQLRFIPFSSLVDASHDTSEFWRATEILSLVQTRRGMMENFCQQEPAAPSVHLPSRRAVNPICRGPADHQLCPQCPHMTNRSECELFRDSCREPPVPLSERPRYCDRKYGRGRAVLFPADYSRCRCCDECVMYRELDQSCIPDDYDFEIDEILPVTSTDFRAGCNPYWGDPEQELKALRCDKVLRRCVPSSSPTVTKDQMPLRHSFRFEPLPKDAECPTSCRGYHCKEGFVDESLCKPGAFLPNKDTCNCCGRCSTYQQLNEKCAEFKKTVHNNNGTQEVEVEEEILEPGCDDGLVCRQGYCEDIHAVQAADARRRGEPDAEANEPCKREVKLFKKKYGPDGHLHYNAPQCTPLWLYAPVQCRGFVCFCALEDGTFIHGIKVPRVEVSNMNCDCAREKCRTGSDIECDGYGNYKEPVFTPHPEDNNTSEGDGARAKLIDHNVVKRGLERGLELRSLWDSKGFDLQDQCQFLLTRAADLDTVLIYPYLDFESEFAINSSHLEGHESVQKSWPRIKSRTYYSLPDSMLFTMPDDKKKFNIEPKIFYQGHTSPLTLKLRFRSNNSKWYYKDFPEKNTTPLLKVPVDLSAVNKAPLAPKLQKPLLEPVRPPRVDVRRYKCVLDPKLGVQCDDRESGTDNKANEGVKSSGATEHTQNEQPAEYGTQIEIGNKKYVGNRDKQKKSKIYLDNKTYVKYRTIPQDYKATSQQDYRATSPMKSSPRLNLTTPRHKTRMGPKLKVFVVPFSHNDPGWLYTFEAYFQAKTRHIIDNVLTSLMKYPKLTFIWSEISLLEAWWRDSTTKKRQTLKKLVTTGRFEIVAGGWVMPDEACTHYYPLIDQFIEGHQWIRNTLGISPRSGWSVAPFGHGPTVPYILQNSGITGTVIQRINFAWKRWLVMWQVSEFYWLTGWAASAAPPTLVVHHLPFSLYDIRSSCGPDPFICARYDFSEYPNNRESLHNKSHTLIEQYRVIGALTPHNVALVPLGGDFKYAKVQDLEIQYENYMKMFDYINSHQELFNTEVQFGTVSDFFNAIKKSQKYIPTLEGDFFPYADKPNAFWSGFFTSRSRFKLLSRQFEHQLRTSEIMFSLISNILQLTNTNLVESENMYGQLVVARRSLGLFQHHDAITGTSRAFVIEDYERKMLKGISQCLQIQQKLLAAIMFPIHMSRNIVESSLKWEVYRKPVNILKVLRLENKLIVFNPLAEPRTDVVTLQSSSPFVRIYDTRRNTYVQHQIGPSFRSHRMNEDVIISTSEFEVMFVASLPALAAVVFNIVQHFDKSAHCSVICDSCNRDNYIFKVTPLYSSDKRLENSVFTLFLNNVTGFLRKIYRKDVKRDIDVHIQFGVYENTGSGAYLFKINRNEQQQQHKRKFWDYHTKKNAIHKTIIIKGPIATTVRTYHLPIMAHVMTIYNVESTAFSRGVLLENLVDFDFPPLKHNIDMFMRIQTDIRNGEPPVFYTDQNGFQYQKRVKVDKKNIEGNVYPVTTMAWLQDVDTRLTVLTDRAQGVSACAQGRLELMLGRTTSDDHKGLDEGVTETKAFSQYWLLLEPINKPSLPKNPSHTRPRKLADAESPLLSIKPKCNKGKSQVYELPSETAGHLSRAFNYPVQVYSVNSMDGISEELITFQNFAYGFPAGLHLVTLRTMSHNHKHPKSTFLMLLHRPLHSCHVGNISNAWPVKFTKSSGFTGLSIAEVSSVSLTGLQKYRLLSGLSEIQVEPMEINTFKIILNRYGYSAANVN